MNIRPAVITALLFCPGLGASHAQDARPTATPDPDARTALHLTPAERAAVLQEMHLFLSGVGEMAGALARNDMAGTAQAARRLGIRMAVDVPPSLREKLPMEFRQRGAEVHRDFDQIALDADSLGDVSYSLNQLSGTLHKCVACHARYQIRPSPARAGR
ncbi:MAG: hypothetical protein LDL16_10630 [Thiobacillus sp.]|nr:hypothetical protein [Thiobacillus sp.]